MSLKTVWYANISRWNISQPSQSITNCSFLEIPLPWQQSREKIGDPVQYIDFSPHLLPTCFPFQDRGIWIPKTGIDWVPLCVFSPVLFIILVIRKWSWLASLGTVSCILKILAKVLSYTGLWVSAVLRSLGELQACLHNCATHWRTPRWIERIRPPLLSPELYPHPQEIDHAMIALC